MYAFWEPGNLDPHTADWVRWVQGTQDDYEHKFAFEFLEDFDPVRIVFIGALGLLIIIMLTGVWVGKGGNPSTVFTVMSFVLGVATGEWS